jgi:FkbM family methyltransferase
LYKFRNGTKLKARLATYDRCVVGEVWFHRVYSPTGFEIETHDVVVDIGAHIGIFSLFASRQAPCGLIIAIEPIEENFLILEENIRINGRTNIIALNRAVASMDTVRPIYFYDKDTAGHSLFTMEKNDKQVRSVRTISLDFLFSSFQLVHIDFMKMDCEGAEYEILFSCSKEILSKINKLAIECHPLDAERNLKQLANYLADADFEVNTSERSGMLYAWRPPGGPQPLMNTLL